MAHVEKVFLFSKYGTAEMFLEKKNITLKKANLLFLSSSSKDFGSFGAPTEWMNEWMNEWMTL